MNCKEIKTAIDMTSRRNPIGSEAQAHLNGCPDCRLYSDQSNALLALITAQPRVEAPADFEFKLRARIARTQAQPASPFGFIENFFGQTFSFRQAAASLAALAIMAAGTTFYYTHNREQSQQSGAIVAQNAVKTPQVVTVPESPAEPASISVPETKMATSAKPRVSVESLKPAVFTEAPRPQTNLVATVVSKEDTIRVFNREKGQVNEFSARPIVYGAEGMAMAKPAAYGGF